MECRDERAIHRNGPGNCGEVKFQPKVSSALQLSTFIALAIVFILILFSDLTVLVQCLLQINQVKRTSIDLHVTPE